jgi:alpha-tubulin suppressor-like RCC1 family protein
MNRFAVNAGMLVGGEVGACVLDGNTNLCWGEGMFTPGAPANVPVLKDVGFGGTAACGVAKTGLRGCWGLPIWGELGDGVNDNTMSPKSWEVGTETSMYSAITTQHGHSCALTTSGGVNCWGTNYNGETSNVMPGGFTLAVRPVATETGTTLGNCTAVSTGSTATCAICTGAPLCWGAAPNGNLGNGVESNHVYGATPVSVDTGKAWVEIANGDQHACALAGDATLACWGLGIHGEIGDGSHGSNVPTPIPGPP